jgi:hypothetical protein
MMKMAAFSAILQRIRESTKRGLDEGGKAILLNIVFLEEKLKLFNFFQRRMHQEQGFSLKRRPIYVA